MKRAFILLPITLVLYAGWQNRIQTDIFFFENDLNQDTKLFTQKNTYPSLVTTVPDDKKIDMYFVLGESVTKNHMSLYGYNRKTTPYLDSLESNLLSVYKNPISPAGKTAPSLMTMLSRSSTFNKEIFYLSPNLVEELNTAGYNTVWTTYRKMNKANYVYPALINETNTAIDANSIYDDRKILTKTQPHLSQKPSVYFMHMYGSHINYVDRTPKELKHFALQKSDSNKQRIIDAYDDSIRVLDIFLKDLHSMAQQHSQKTKRKFVIVYVSDHGQNIFGDGSDWFAHPRAGIKQQPNGWEVPLLLFNEKNLPCKNAFPDTESPALSTGDVFWWVLKGLCAIK